MQKIKIAFFGTHEFATTILQGLINSPFIEIELVITQPDKPVGRKKELQKSPIKLLAEKYGLKVEQPNSLKLYILSLKTYDLNIVVDYGLLIPKNILNTPKHKSINIHPSLLPKYRGASPIQTALINGNTETGTTIMLMDEKMDHGPILTQEIVKIDSNDNYPILSKNLAEKANKLLLDTIPKWVDGKIKTKAQNNSNATYCKMLTRDSGLVDFSKSAQEIYNQYRGMTPWPGVWTTVIGDKRLKLLEIKPSNKQIEVGRIKFVDDEIFIGCGEGSIKVLELQLEGKKAMNARSFINGNKEINNMSLRGV